MSTIIQGRQNRTRRRVMEVQEDDGWGIVEAVPLTLRLTRPLLPAAPGGHHLHIRQIEALDTKGQKIKLHPAGASNGVRTGSFCRAHNYARGYAVAVDGRLDTIAHSYYDAAGPPHEDHWMEFELLGLVSEVRILNRLDEDSQLYARRLTGGFLELRRQDCLLWRCAITAERISFDMRFKVDPNMTENQTVVLEKTPPLIRPVQRSRASDDRGSQASSAASSLVFEHTPSWLRRAGSRIAQDGSFTPSPVQLELEQTRAQLERMRVYNHVLAALAKMPSSDQPDLCASRVQAAWRCFLPKATQRRRSDVACRHVQACFRSYRFRVLRNPRCTRSSLLRRVLELQARNLELQHQLSHQQGEDNDAEARTIPCVSVGHDVDDKPHDVDDREAAVEGTWNIKSVRRSGTHHPSWPWAASEGITFQGASDDSFTWVEHKANVDMSTLSEVEPLVRSSCSPRVAVQSHKDRFRLGCWYLYNQHAVPIVSGCGNNNEGPPRIIDKTYKPAAPIIPAGDMADKLMKKVAELHAAGVLTDEEYAFAKSAVIAVEDGVTQNV